MRRSPLILVPLWFLVACEPAEPAIEADQLAQPSTFANNPDTGNPRILRFGERIGFVVIDSETNRFALHAGTDRQFGCNVPPELFAIEDVQRILHNPDDPLIGQINEVRLGRGVFIAVYEGWDAWNASGLDCADLFSRKLAEGSGNLTNTDNDIYAYLLDRLPRENYNAFGFAAQGRLTRVSGETAPYNGVNKCIWDGIATTIHCVAKINF